MNLNKLCSIQYTNFEELFNDFFVVRNLDILDLIKNIDKKHIYNNYQIKKIEIKNSLNYSDFLDHLLEHFNSYYYDGNRNKTKTDKHRGIAYRWINNYTPKKGVLLNKFLENSFGNKKGSDFIKNDKLEYQDQNDEKLIKEYLEQNIIKDVLSLVSGEKYIILTKENKITIRSESEILGNLHGDIGEFILFFFVESLLNSPLLFSKISHSKSSGEDKIKGSDGIHIKKGDNGQPVFLFLESKFKKDFSECIAKAIESQKEFLENRSYGGIDNEIQILQANSATIDIDYKELFSDGFEKYIDPYFIGDKNEIIPFDLVTGLIYECNQYKDLIHGKKTTEEYVQKSTLLKIESILKGYKGIEKIMNDRNVIIFLLPLINNEKLIKHFLDKTNT